MVIKTPFLKGRAPKGIIVSQKCLLKLLILAVNYAYFCSVLYLTICQFKDLHKNPDPIWSIFHLSAVGYVKTTLVEIDFNSLKNRPAQPAYEPEIYDDIDVVSTDNG